MALRGLLTLCVVGALSGFVPARAALNNRAATAIVRHPQLASRLLHAHNLERARRGVAPLAWDSELARSAAAYAAVLAARGRLAHSPEDSRRGQLENLWMGTRGAYSPEQMIGHWTSERILYRPGRFPAVSTTGRWSDVAHYTQMVWPTTTHVGCAIQPARNWDFLICRYSPPGNIVGARTV